MSKKTQATLVLVIMFLGFIATYKLDSFWGLLLNHGFLAALIGGLADWFAVTALFRKPLALSLIVRRYYLVIVNVSWTR